MEEYKRPKIVFSIDGKNKEAIELHREKWAGFENSLVKNRRLLLADRGLHLPLDIGLADFRWFMLQHGFRILARKEQWQ